MNAGRADSNHLLQPVTSLLEQNGRMGGLVGLIQAFKKTARETLQPVAELIAVQTPNGKREGGGMNPLLKILQGE